LERNVIPENWITGIDIQIATVLDNKSTSTVAVDSSNFEKEKIPHLDQPAATWTKIFHVYCFAPHQVVLQRIFWYQY
jgi:hypothetical protein